MRNPARAALIGGVVAAVVTLPGLGSGTLWDNSETAYGEVAREILLTRDWVVMHLNGLPWYVQPPLYFWIAALLAKAFGVGSLAFRLPAALATIAMGAMTGYAVTRQAGMRAGLYASVILSTCLMQAIVGRLAVMDALLDLSVALAVFWWFRALQSGRGAYFVFGWVALGFGFLAKGPVAPVAAALVIIPFALWNRRHAPTHLPGWRPWSAGLALFLAIIAPWFLALIAQSGAHSVAELIGHYTFGRYTQTIENQSGPIWYYLPVIVLGFFPWIAFLPSAIAFGVRRLRFSPGLQGDERDAMLRLAFSWIVAPLLFFSLAKTKLPNYIALEFPALALLVAMYFEDAVLRVRNRSRELLISALAVPVTIAMVAVAIVWFSRDNRLTGDLHGVALDLMFVGSAIFVGSLVTAALLRRPGSLASAPLVLGAAMAVAVLFLGVLALPSAEQFKPVPALAAVVDAERKPGDVVAIQNVSGGNALLFYTQPHIYVLARPDEKPGGDGVDPRNVICGAKRAWVVAPIVRPVYDPTYGRSRRTVARAAKAQLFLYDGPPCSGP
ncbi:MAG: glycosyltransferase family 39 protein [Candidatus Eremiobacteraeota bacterium]|nr:glycosyltransferase family 39 protein [Candidatus Eremiobacteraeota bacterium]